jgi:hypothetical protein
MAWLWLKDGPVQCMDNASPIMLNWYSMWNCKKTTFFFLHYLCHISTLDMGVFGYNGVI